MALRCAAAEAQLEGVKKGVCTLFSRIGWVGAGKDVFLGGGRGGVKGACIFCEGFAKLLRAQRLWWSLFPSEPQQQTPSAQKQRVTSCTLT